MVGILGVLAAGAAQGYGTAKNQEVDNHNAVAIEQMREQMREEFESRRFSRERQANKEDAAINAQYEQVKYQRDRENSLADEDRKFNREMEKNKLLEEGRNSRTSATNAARLRAAEMRASASGGSGGGLLNATDKAQSPMGKAIQDMVNMGLAETPQDAQMKIERSGIMKEIMKNPMLANDPNRIAAALSQWENSMGAQQQQSAADFIFNPQTGKLEPAK